MPEPAHDRLFGGNQDDTSALLVLTERPAHLPRSGVQRRSSRAHDYLGSLMASPLVPCDLGHLSCVFYRFASSGRLSPWKFENDSHAGMDIKSQFYRVKDCGDPGQPGRAATTGGSADNRLPMAEVVAADRAEPRPGHRAPDRLLIGIAAPGSGRNPSVSDGAPSPLRATASPPARSISTADKLQGYACPTGGDRHWTRRTPSRWPQLV